MAGAGTSTSKLTPWADDARRRASATGNGATAATLGAALSRHYAALRELAPAELVQRRRAKYRAMGVFSAGGAA